MKKFAFIVVAAMLVSALIPAVSACGNADRTEELHAELESMGYTLAFEDNFDGDEIDYTKCTGCLVCVQKCPRKCIREM